MGHRRNDQPAVVLETDEAPVEEVVDTRGEKESIFAIQSFTVVRIAPGFAVTRN